MKKIKEIHLVFENCDSAKLKVGEFDYLEIKGVTDSLTLYNEDYLYTEKNCQSFEVTITKKGMTQTCCFIDGRKKIGDRLGDPVGERIKRWHDICHVGIIYIDDTEDYITVPWQGEHDENELQKVENLDESIKIIIRSKI